MGTPSPAGGPIAKYDGKRDSVLRIGALSVVLTSGKGKDDDRFPIASGREDGQVAFTLSLEQSTRGTDDDSNTDFAELAAVRSDPASPRPSLVFSSF